MNSFRDGVRLFWCLGREGLFLRFCGRKDRGGKSGVAGVFGLERCYFYIDSFSFFFEDWGKFFRYILDYLSFVLMICLF